MHACAGMMTAGGLIAALEISLFPGLAAGLFWAGVDLFRSSTSTHTCLASTQCHLQARSPPPTPVGLVPEGYGYHASLSSHHSLAFPTASISIESGPCKHARGMVNDGITPQLCCSALSHQQVSECLPRQWLQPLGRPLPGGSNT